MTQITTQNNPFNFEDLLVRHIETLGSNLDVTYDGQEFAVSDPSGNAFRVQVVLTSEIPSDTMVCGLFNMDADAPTVDVDGEEYTIVRQW